MPLGSTRNPRPETNQVRACLEKELVNWIFKRPASQLIVLGAGCGGGTERHYIQRYSDKCKLVNQVLQIQVSPKQ